MSLLLLWSLLSPSFACTTPGNVLMGAWPDGRSEVPLDSQILLWFYSSPEQYTATLLDAEGAEVSAEIVYDDSARFRGWRILPDAPLAPETTYTVSLSDDSWYTDAYDDEFVGASFTTGTTLSAEIGAGPSVQLKRSLSSDEVTNWSSCDPDHFWRVTLDVQSGASDAPGYRLLHVVEVDAAGGIVRTLHSGATRDARLRLTVRVDDVDDPLCLAVLEEDTVGDRTPLSEPLCVGESPGEAGAGCATAGGGAAGWLVGLVALLSRRRSG